MSDRPKLLDKARAGLILDHPFFASMLLPMPMIEENSIPTMATDGEEILYNRAFVESMNLKEITFILAHEVLHCVLDHMGRRGARSPNRWNQAADYCINEILINEKIGSMPHGGLYNPQLTKQGNNTAEGVYRLIPEENEKKGSGQKGGALDQVNDSGTKNGKEPTDEATKAEKSAQIKVRVIQARNAAKMQGKMSQGLDRLLGDALEPQVDWKAELRRFICERAKVEHSFARPKRRFLGEDIYLPSLLGEKMGKLVVAVDCSGSVNDALLNEFTTEIMAIREDTHPSEIKVIYFDSKVCGVETFGPDDEIKLKPKGGGGTAFSPVFDYINKQDEEPVAVVVLTDLYCNDYGKCPSYPVLWCCFEKPMGSYGNVPFGEVLKIKESI